MTTISRITTTSPTDTGANNLKSVAADAANPDKPSSTIRTRTSSNKVAQVFPAPGSISGGSNRIPQARTDAIIIGSFDSSVSLKPGGGAGFVYKYIEGPIASVLSNTRVVNDAETASLDGIVNKLKAQKRTNNGQALSRITIVTHGNPGELVLGNSSVYRVSQIVPPIMANGLLKPGGRLVLGGCSIAGDTQACSELSALAQKFKIVIQGSETPASLGSENLDYMTFYPNGKITRNLGPFAPF